MCRAIPALLTTAFIAVAGLAEDAKPIAFDKADLGKLPSGWTGAKTGTGEGSVWKLVADDTTPSKSGLALAQTADGPDQLFNLCILDKSSFKDCELSVAVKAKAGKLDQGGGVIWRCKDANNYYICRFNPLEDNFRVYVVKDGKRKQLASVEHIKLPANEWFTVAIKHDGDRITCSLNGKQHLDVTDKTLPDAGQVGVWSKADAVSHFDKFESKPAKK